MTDHVLQHRPGIDVIVAKLRAAVSVAEQEDTVGALGIMGLFQETALDLARNPVDAANGWQDPEFVSYPDVPVSATINLHVAIRWLRREILKIRLIAILIQIAQIGASIVGVNMFTRRNVRQSMADRLAILNHVRPFLDVTQSKFMSASNILAKRYGVVVHSDFCSLRQISQRDRNVILHMDFDVLHINPGP